MKEERCRNNHFQDRAQSDITRFQAKHIRLSYDTRTKGRKKKDSLPDRFTHPSRVGIGNIGESEGSTLDDCRSASTIFERSEKIEEVARVERIYE